MNSTQLLIRWSLIRWSLILTFACSAGGCATIVSGRKDQVTINNSGGPTFFSVVDEKGNIVHSGLTPQQVTLKTSTGPFRPAEYTVVYAGQEGAVRNQIDTKINWWTAGNIVIGGVPGLVIDAATGAIWKFDSEIQGQVPASSAVADLHQGQAIVSGRDVPVSGHPANAFPEADLGQERRLPAGQLQHRGDRDLQVSAHCTALLRWAQV